MEIIFNLEDVKSAGLPILQYFILYCINNDIPLGNVGNTNEDLVYLQNEGYIRVVESKITLKLKSVKLFESNDKQPISEFVAEWRGLFPSGMTWGRPTKGSKSSCVKKMTKFMKNNKKVARVDILNATRFYIDNKMRGGVYEGQSADYFIDKNGDSTLEGVIEHIKEKGINVDNHLDDNPFIKQV
jgi:hypothetical protein